MGALLMASNAANADGPGVVFEGNDGPGKGKHIVLIAGDDEYRSEDIIPQLGKILAVHHGFKCTVLFALNKKTGEIDPGAKHNIPGLEVLNDADLMIMHLRFRDLPDDQMKQIMDYTNSGKPIMGLRTSTHAFNIPGGKAYSKWSFRAKGETQGGYGRQVFGETWISHYGHHGRESTRGIIVEDQKDNPIVNGCEDIWGPSDVYAITELHGDCTPLVLGQPLTGMDPEDPPNKKKPPVPVAWTKTYTGSEGKTARVFTTTMGHAHDLKSEGFRRLLVNAAYWCVGMEDEIPERAKVDFVGEYDPNPIGIGKFKKGLKPSDHAIE
jgi:type 1 glutamine amidotransferase